VGARGVEGAWGTVVGLGCGNKFLLKVKIGYQLDITSKLKSHYLPRDASKGGKSIIR
jgi:hypothetical protein